MNLLPVISRMLILFNPELSFSMRIDFTTFDIKKLILVLLGFMFFACQQKSESLDTLYSLPKKLKEVSGIIYAAKDNLLWALEDSGNANAVYGLNFENGKIEKSIIITGTENIDWEDITKDQEGNLYIGDFGNNDNLRKDLCIYKIDANSLNQEDVTPAYKITFTYPEQKDFPPKKTELFYDVEGFFEFKNNFYLFTKNRSKGFDGTAFLYKIPNTPGFHEAQFIGEFNTCDNYNHCAITSAAISPDASKVVVLCHDKMIAFENFQGDRFLQGKRENLDLDHFSQKEAVCFKDNELLIIADEKTKSVGGNVYTMSIKKLKSKP